MRVTGHYILDGTTPVEELDLLTWAGWFQRAERHVAETWVTPTVRVSTVFLGLDHQHDPWRRGAPVLWETMVFEAGEAGDMQRYSTYHDAEQGHEAMVEEVRARLAAETGAC